MQSENGTCVGTGHEGLDGMCGVNPGTRLRPGYGTSGTSDFETSQDYKTSTRVRDSHGTPNSPLSERIAYGFDITALLVTERILPVSTVTLR